MRPVWASVLELLRGAEAPWRAGSGWTDGGEQPESGRADETELSGFVPELLEPPAAAPEPDGDAPGAAARRPARSKRERGTASGWRSDASHSGCLQRNCLFVIQWQIWTDVYQRLCVHFTRGLMSKYSTHSLSDTPGWCCQAGRWWRWTGCPERPAGWRTGSSSQPAGCR